MSGKGTNAFKAANIRISTLVWKLHRAIENAKEQDIPCTEVDAVSKFAMDSFKFFLEFGVRYNNLLFLNFNSIFFNIFSIIMGKIQ